MTTTLRFAAFALLLFSVSACSNKDGQQSDAADGGYRVTGSLEANAAAGSRVVVQRAAHRRFEPIDTVLVEANGKFVFNGSTKDDAVLRLNSESNKY